MNTSLPFFALFWVIFCIIPLAHFLTLEEFRVYTQLKELDCGLSKLNPIQKIKSSKGMAFLMSQPWMALIYAEKDINDCHCGGTLISERFVLTSAHCLAFCPPSSEFKVRLGGNNLTTAKDCILYGQKTICAPMVEEFSVIKSISHDNFVYNQLGNDIALLRLDRKVVFKDHIRPICLPLSPEVQKSTSFIGQSYISLRWKQTGKILEGTLNEENVTTEQCPVDAHQSFLCTTENTECHENSGGPLIRLGRYLRSTRQMMFGLASHGKGLCGKGQKAYYTNLSIFMPWILNTLAGFSTF